MSVLTSACTHGTRHPVHGHAKHSEPCANHPVGATRSRFVRAGRDGSADRVSWSPRPWSSRQRSQGRLAQRESASFTPKRSLVRSQYRPPALPQVRDTLAPLEMPERSPSWRPQIVLALFSVIATLIGRQLSSDWQLTRPSGQAPVVSPPARTLDASGPDDRGVRAGTAPAPKYLSYPPGLMMTHFTSSTDSQQSRSRSPAFQPTRTWSRVHRVARAGHHSSRSAHTMRAITGMD